MGATLSPLLMLHLAKPPFCDTRQEKLATDVNKVTETIPHFYDSFGRMYVRLTQSSTMDGGRFTFILEDEN